MNCKRIKLILGRQLVGSFLIAVLAFSSVPNLLFAQDKTRLSNEDRTKIFDKVWSLVNTRYYDPKMNGVDWLGVKRQYEPLIAKTGDTQDFFDVIKKMVGEMHDAHTRFLTPLQARQFRERKATTIGVLLSKVEGKTVVEKVLPNVEGELAKVKPGMIVRTIDGVKIEKRLTEARKEVGRSSSKRAIQILTYRRLLRGEPGTSIKVGLTDENGKNFEVLLVRKVVPQISKAIGEILPSGIGYLAVSSFRAPISGEFKKTLLKLKDTPSIIIDLRYNGGGSISEVLKMAGMFLDKRYSFGKFMRRKGSAKQSLKKFSAGRIGGQVYSKPVLILTSKFSASGSELFASGLQELGRAKVVGGQTCGCLLGISRKYRLRGGSELHISDIGFLSAKGNIYEKVGITPDKVVPQRIADLQNGFDRGISEAENILTSAAAQINN